MSIKRMSAVWEFSSRKGSALIVLLSLADRADDSGYCWPGLLDTARRARISKRHTINIINELEETNEIYVHREQGQTNKYIIPHGLSPDEFIETLQKKFNYSYDDAVKVFQKMGGENISPVKPSSPGGETQFTPPVKPSSPESSFNQNETSILMDFAKLSAVFWTASGIPAPAFGSKDWEDWESGTNRLLKMNPTEAEIYEAIKILDGISYHYKTPGSLVKTVNNIRKKEQRITKANAQSLGGEFQE